MPVRAHPASPGMGACASRSTQAAADSGGPQKASVNEQAPQKPPPPKTPSSTSPANGVAKHVSSDAATANGTAPGGPDLVASAPTSGLDEVGLGKSHAVALADGRQTPERPPPVPLLPAGGPEAAATPSAPHAAANGHAAAAADAAADREPSAAAPVDLQATAGAAVLAGGAYRSNQSGPARPACQQQRLATVGDIRDTLKQAHDPAIGARSSTVCNPASSTHREANPRDAEIFSQMGPASISYFAAQGPAVCNRSTLVLAPALGKTCAQHTEVAQRKHPAHAQSNC